MTREAFEAWYQLEVSGCNGEWIAKDESGQYLEPSTARAWQAWQAATDAALERAAEMCDELSIAEECAAAVRALKENKP